MNRMVNAALKKGGVDVVIERQVHEGLDLKTTAFLHSTTKCLARPEGICKGVPFCFIKLEFEIKLGLFMLIVCQQPSLIPLMIVEDSHIIGIEEVCSIRSRIFGV